jgi:hypothetical protein
MTTTTTIIKRTVHGDERVVHGSWAVTAGATTAVISHGLKKLRNIFITPSGTAVTAKLDVSLATGTTASTVGFTFGEAHIGGTFVAYGE